MDQIDFKVRPLENSLWESIRSDEYCELYDYRYWNVLVTVGLFHIFQRYCE